MTAKRFEFGDSVNLVIDNVESNSYGSYNITSLITVLNELHEENQKLKQYRKAIWNFDSSKIIRVNKNTGEVDLVDKEIQE